MPQPRICLLPNVFSHDYASIGVETLQAIRDMGYDTIELGSESKPFPRAWTDQLKAMGFRQLAHGSGLATMDERPDPCIDEALRLGEEYLICYWPWLDGATNLTEEQVKATAAALNRIGRACRRRGLGFAFHNHGVEFALVNGVPACELMLKETDPDAVALELDVYHLLRTAVDPLPFIRAHSARIPILHLNAMDNCGPKPVVGDGMARFEELLEAAAHARHWVVEGHKQAEPMRFVRESRARVAAILERRGAADSVS